MEFNPQHIFNPIQYLTWQSRFMFIFFSTKRQLSFTIRSLFEKRNETMCHPTSLIQSSSLRLLVKRIPSFVLLCLDHFSLEHVRCQRPRHQCCASCTSTCIMLDWSVHKLHYHDFAIYLNALLINCMDHSILGFHLTNTLCSFPFSAFSLSSSPQPTLAPTRHSHQHQACDVPRHSQPRSLIRQLQLTCSVLQNLPKNQLKSSLQSHLSR